jgi:hypothetical protein
MYSFSRGYANNVSGGKHKHVWIKTFYKLWTELMCPALKVVFLPCSQREETDSVRTLSSVSCALTRTSRSNSVWISMRLVCSRGTLRWRLKNLCQTTRTGSLSVSLTPSLNPKMTLTKFMCHVTPRVSIYFFLSSTLFLFFIFTFFFYNLSSEPV